MKGLLRPMAGQLAATELLTEKANKRSSVHDDNENKKYQRKGEVLPPERQLGRSSNVTSSTRRVL